MMGWLTGQVQPGSGNFVKGPSIDQVLAPGLSGGKPFPSLQMAVRWGTGRAHGRLSPMDCCTFEGAAPFSPIPPRLDPVAIWKTLFNDIARPATERAWDASILDAVDRRYAKLAQRLGAADRQRLEAHLERIRELEKRVAATAGGRACAPPPLIDTSDYNPQSGLNSADDGSITDLATDAAIPKVGKLMMDMTVMALACDLTAVGFLQWSDSEAKYTCPWLNLPETHYFYENGGGYRPAELERIYTWYSSQHAYLLQQLAGVDMGGPIAARRDGRLLRHRIAASGDAREEEHAVLARRRRAAGRTLGHRGGRHTPQQPAGVAPQPVRRCPHHLRRPALLHRPAAEPGLSPEGRYSVTECWAARGLASSGDDAAPTQGNPPPLTSFSSNPASSVVVAPATNAPATRVRIRWRSARSIRSRSNRFSSPSTIRCRRRGESGVTSAHFARSINLLTLSQPSSCSRRSPVSTFVLLSLDDATPNVSLEFLSRENLVPTSALRAESLSAARYTTLTMASSMLDVPTVQGDRRRSLLGLWRILSARRILPVRPNLSGDLATNPGVMAVSACARFAVSGRSRIIRRDR